MRSSGQRQRGSRSIIATLALVATGATLLRANNVLAQDGIGACRNEFSGPECLKCLILDLQDCPDSLKMFLLVVCGLVVAAAIAIFLFPEILISLGFGGLLLEAGLAEEPAAVEGMGPLIEEFLGPEQGMAPLVDETFTKMAESEMPGISIINSEGYTTNCGQVLINLANLRAGGEAVVAGDTGLMQASEVAEEFGSYWQESSYERIEEQLLAQGEGSQGGVEVQCGTLEGSGTGHVFYAENIGGRISWADAQLQPPVIYHSIADLQEALGPYQWVKFLPIN